MWASRSDVGVFTMPQEFPCGEGSSCCGPIGQPEQEIAALTAALEDLGVHVEVHNVRTGKVAPDYANVERLLNSFGWGALPILTLDGEVVCMGRSTIGDMVRAIQEKAMGV